MIYINHKLQCPVTVCPPNSRLPLLSWTTTWMEKDDEAPNHLCARDPLHTEWAWQLHLTAHALYVGLDRGGRIAGNGWSLIHSTYSSVTVYSRLCPAGGDLPQALQGTSFCAQRWSERVQYRCPGGGDLGGVVHAPIRLCMHGKAHL